jgi:hypothetical protein
MKKSILLAGFTALMSGAALNAQVTIGADATPSKAALLELKTQAPDADNVTSTKGGLVLPRVKLVNPATLEPFISTSGLDWTDETKTLHTGLLVYNLTVNADFSKGIYLWDGIQWVVYRHSREISVTADNGLTADGNNVTLGGNLTQTETTIGVDASTQKLKFNITNGGTSNTNGLFFNGLTEHSSTDLVSTMSVNTLTGKVGFSAVAPVEMAFFLSSSEQRGIADDLNNNGKEVIATFVPGDEKFNNLVTFNDADDTFTVQKSGVLEISAFVSYSPRTDVYNGTNPTGDAIGVCVLNATLQVKYASGGDWTNYSSARNLWVGEGAAFRMTLSTPPVLIEVQQNDKFRLVIMRPAGLGDPHKSANVGTAYTGIAPAFGTSFSKGIKILAVK